MSILSRKATFQIGAHIVTLDKEDIDRVAIREWIPAQIDQGRVMFCTDISDQKDRPVFQLLSGFILGVQPDVYVELKDRSEQVLTRDT